MGHDITTSGVGLPDTAYNMPGVINQTGLTNLQQWLTSKSLPWANRNKYEYIVALRFAPFDMSRFAHAPRGLIIAGEQVTPSVSVSFIDGLGNVDPVLDLGQIVIPYRQYTGFETNSFWNYSPFTTVEIYLPFVGFVSVDATEVMGKAIKIRYPFDIQTGNATATLSVDGRIILSRDTKLFIDVPLGASNAQQAYTNTLLTGASIVGGSLKGMATGGTVNVASMASQWVNANQIHVERGTIGTPLDALLSPFVPFAVVKRPRPLVDTNYASLFGKPLCETRKISEMTGFTMVERVHLEGFETATRGELREIEDLLRAGVII